MAHAVRLLAAVLVLHWFGAAAQELVHFPSLEDNGPGQAPTSLDGYVFRPSDQSNSPAVVFCTAAAVFSAAVPD